MKFQHVKNITNDEATMLIGARIGNSYDEEGNVTAYGISGYGFASEMQYLKEVKGVKNITVEINSVGGSVVEGLTIANCIQKYGANTRVVGLAASMAAVCAVSGEKREIVDYGTIMCHPAAGSDDQKLVGILEDSIKNLYKNKTRLNDTTTNTIFEKETYFSNSAKADYNLTQAIEMGVVDAIISSGKKISRITNKKSVTVESLASIYNELLTPKTMSKVNALLGLKNEASEDAAVESISALKAERDALKTESEANKAKLEELEAKIAADKQAKEDEMKAKAASLVDNAIKEKRAKVEDKEKLVNLAVADYDTVKTMLESKASAGKAPQILSVDNKKTAGDRADWTIKDWQKKDSAGLQKIQNETPEVYQTMYDNYYKLGIGNDNFKK